MNKPKVIVLIIDTLLANMLHCYGHKKQLASSYAVMYGNGSAWMHYRRHSLESI